MYAVIQTQGRQYKVAEGDTITVDHIPGAPAGSKITFEEVLLNRDDESNFGTPLVEGASVVGEITEQGRGPKLIIFKKRRRHANSATTRGFRSHVTTVRIAQING